MTNTLPPTVWVVTFLSFADGQPELTVHTTREAAEASCAGTVRDTWDEYCSPDPCPEVIDAAVIEEWGDAAECRLTMTECQVNPGPLVPR